MKTTRIKTLKYSFVKNYQGANSSSSAWVDYLVIAADLTSAKKLLEVETGEQSTEYVIECEGYARTQLRGVYFAPRVLNNTL